MKLAFLFLVIVRIAFGASCDEWFRSSHIPPESDSCFLRCTTLRTGMDTFGCPAKCTKFCKSSTKAWIFFGNGMFNTREDAQQAAKQFQRLLSGQLSKYPDLAAVVGNLDSLEIAYNADENVFLKLLQVATQKGKSIEGEFFRWLANLSASPDWFRKKAVELAFSIDEEFLVKDPSLKEQVRQYSEHLEKGDAVIVIAHSQGNFYANAAWRILNSPSFKMSVIPIASPHLDGVGEEIINDSPYTTLFSDGVIGLVPFHYPPNVRNNPAGLFDHEFVKHYLGGNNSGPKILRDTACVVSWYRPLPINLDPINDNAPRYPACASQIPYPERD